MVEWRDARRSNCMPGVMMDDDDEDDNDDDMCFPRESQVRLHTPRVAGWTSAHSTIIARLGFF